MNETLLEALNLTKVFEARRGIVDALTRRPREVLTAVDGVDLEVRSGEVLGVVGESGCGKSTLARCLLGLQQPTAGEVRFEGQVLDRKRTLNERRRIQIVFQDPYSSLNARMRIGEAIREVLLVHRLVDRRDVDARVEDLLGLVGLTPDIADVYPRQLSGGQRQRVSIARALAVEPDVLIADEPVSALDVSVQATVLNLLADLRERLGLTVVVIAHDLSVVRYLCDRVAVMYLGRIVELGPTASVFATPQHPYTQALLAAAPRLLRAEGGTAELAGEPPSPYDLPPGCRFHPRCPIATDRCTVEDPPFVADPDGGDHYSACHFAWNLTPLIADDQGE